MQSLEVLGYAEYYYLDNDKVFNKKKSKYVKEIGEYRYRLRTKEGIYKSITLKEIYKRLFNKVFCIDEVELLEGEIFREIEGTGGNYEASNLGRIKSKTGNHAIILKPTITEKGYERVQLHVEGHRFNKFIHSLCAAAWLEPPKSIDVEIHHKDFNKLNNAAENLEYLNKLQHVKKHMERRINSNYECSKSEENHN